MSRRRTLDPADVGKATALLSSHFINFYSKSTVITALTQTYQTVFNRWQFHAFFSFSACAALV